MMKPMSLSLAILVVDFGLVVLIWMTQLISYPGLQYLEGEKLLAWHTQYTWRIGVIVMPLMLAQVALKGLHVLHHFSAWAFISALLVGLVWLSTFLQAVPIHNQIAAGQATDELLARLVRVNGWRTALWTIVFFIDLWGFSRESVSH
jgi:hypothetical protein